MYIPKIDCYKRLGTFDISVFKRKVHEKEWVRRMRIQQVRQEVERENRLEKGEAEDIERRVKRSAPPPTPTSSPWSRGVGGGAAGGG